MSMHVCELTYEHVSRCDVVHLTQPNTVTTLVSPRGDTGDMGGACLCAHYMGGKREKTQMVTEGHRFMMTNIWDILGVLLIADRCVGVYETQ